MAIKTISLLEMKDFSRTSVHIIKLEILINIATFQIEILRTK